MKKLQKTNAARLLDRAKIAYELMPYEVDENDLSLAAIPGVDRAGGIEDRHAVFRGQTAARTNLRLVAGRQLHGDRGGHTAKAVGLEREILRGVQVEARIVLVRLARNLRTLAQLDKTDRQHIRSASCSFLRYYTVFLTFLQALGRIKVDALPCPYLK